MVVAREEAEEHIQGPKDLTETPTGFAKKKELTTSWFYRRGDVLTIHSCFLVVFFMFFSFPPHNVGKTKKHQLWFVKNRLSSLFFLLGGDVDYNLQENVDNMRSLFLAGWLKMAAIIKS